MLPQGLLFFFLNVLGDEIHCLTPTSTEQIYVTCILDAFLLSIG